MMDDNQELIIAYFEKVIEGIKDGVLEITSLDERQDYMEHYIEKPNGYKVVDGRFLTGEGTIELRYKAKSKSVKSRQKIYKEIVAHVWCHHIGLDADPLIRLANIVAIQNTNRIFNGEITMENLSWG